MKQKDIDISDYQADFAYALGEQAAKEKDNFYKDNPFKKDKLHFHWWELGFRSHSPVLAKN
jgi:hypothetical protein